MPATSSISTDRGTLPVVATSSAAVLLVALGDRLALVYLAGKKPLLLLAGTLDSLRGVDVDTMLEFHRHRVADRVRPAQVVAASTRAHHARIVEGARMAADDGPALAEVLRHGFDNLAERAANPKVRQKHQRVCGRTRVRYVTDHLYKLVVAGCRDLHGRPGQIIRQIQERVPGFKISADAFGDVLRLLLAAGTPIVALVSDYIWEIKIVGLNRPESEQHRKFCDSTDEICRINEAPRGVSEPAIETPSKAMKDTVPQVEGPAQPSETKPSTPGSVEPNATVLLTAVLLGAKLAIARTRSDAASELVAAREEWSKEREEIEKRFLDAQRSIEDLLVRTARVEVEKQAALEERASLRERLERVEALARVAQETAAAERAELLARAERAEVEAQRYREEISQYQILLSSKQSAAADDGESAYGSTDVQDADCTETGLGERCEGQQRGTRDEEPSTWSSESSFHAHRPNHGGIADGTDAATGSLLHIARTNVGGRGDRGQLGPRGPPVVLG